MKIPLFLCALCGLVEHGAASNENVLMVSYGPFIGAAIERRAPPVIITFKRKVMDKWDAGLVAGDLNLSHEGTNFIELNGARYFGQNNSGFTVGLSYDAQWYEDRAKDDAYLVQSLPLGIGYLAKWKHVVHDFYLGYGPSIRGERRISTLAVGRLALGIQF